MIDFEILPDGRGRDRRTGRIIGRDEFAAVPIVTRVKVLMTDAARTFTSDDSDSDPTGQLAWEARQANAWKTPANSEGVSFAPSPTKIDISGSTTNGQAEWEAWQRNAWKAGK